MAKETRLNDTAEIYKPREGKTERQKLKDMSFRDKVTYFNDYYRTKTIVGIILIGFLIYFGYTVFGPRTEAVLYIASLNGSIEYDSGNLLKEDLEDYFEIDTNKEEIIVDTSIFLDDSSEYGRANFDKLSMYIMSQQIDVFIADEETFSKYVKQDYFSKLSDQLPTQLFSKLSDSFYFSTTEEDSKEVAYGIYLENSSLYSEDYTFHKRPVLGILINSKQKENSVSFIDFLFQKH